MIGFILGLLWGYGAVYGLGVATNDLIKEGDLEGSAADNNSELLVGSAFVLLFWWYIIWMNRE